MWNRTFGFCIEKNGFKSIDGLDLSEEMLKIAEQKKYINRYSILI